MLPPDHWLLLATVSLILGWCALYYLLYWRTASARKLPPCPVYTLPLIGNILSVDQNPRKQIKAWHRQCGDLFRLHFGSTLVVVVSGYSKIKETLVKKSSMFSDRPLLFVNEVIGLGKSGIVFNSGAVWKEHRAVTLHIFKDFITKDNLFLPKIEEEIHFFVEALANMEGKAVDIRHFVYTSTFNIICSFVVGKRFDYDDNRFQYAIDTFDKLLECSISTAPLDFFPFLKYLPGDIFKARRLEKHTMNFKQKVIDFISEVEESDRTGDKYGDADNFISAYNSKRNEKLKNGKETTLSRNNLLRTIMDFFGAGTETVSATIAWCLIYILNNPGVQTKIHEELDREIGRERAPTLEDKAKLPYLEAVIKETQRLASVVPFSVMHVTTQNVTVGDYLIPKGTTIFPNLDSVLHDSAIWGADADEFHPERFLNKDGSVLHKEEFIPFSTGGRVCLGENFAKMELFLFLASMFQKFKFECPDPLKPPSLESIFRIACLPKPFKIKIVTRT
ncbi:cytochrome p450 ii f2-like protein ii [Plakobranchus ocellatus]|uniref:Cytochrome p450 ii f2-like protein ii n=1 Tax=Plakobranchus ocellatus TaxID=259542 RepID=A0AAV4B193_9GAST|nr:cytochrome p450 ii f2-like protein ii [Plakobranchus ocellatus]